MLALTVSSGAGAQTSDDSCASAFNDMCEDASLVGEGMCKAGTDRSDCQGRRRDHRDPGAFFGWDDRILFDTSAYPWSAIGQLQFDHGGACSGSLIAPSTVLTSAHCLITDRGLEFSGRFITARGREEGPIEAQIIDAHVLDTLQDDPDLTRLIRDNLDLALVRLDAEPGLEAGALRVEVLRDNRPFRRDFISAIALILITLIAAASMSGRSRVVLAALGGLGAVALIVFAARLFLLDDPRRDRIHQAGYSSDTGDNLSGTTGCRILEFRPSGLIGHDCDTVDGDSGSPLLVRRQGEWVIVGVVSHTVRRAYADDPQARDRAYAASAARLPDPDSVFTE